MSDSYSDVVVKLQAMRRGSDTTAPAPGRPNRPTTATPLGTSGSDREQRARILAATVELAAKRGYNGISATRVCKAAGISHPTFRKHFDDAGEAFRAAADEVIEAASAEVDSAIEGAGPVWEDQVAAALRAVLEAVRREPAAARLFFVETLSAGPEGVALYEETVARMLPALFTGRTLSEHGDSLPPMLEETIATGVAWTIHRKVARGEAASIGDTFAPLLETILTPYVGEERAMRAATG